MFIERGKCSQPAIGPVRTINRSEAEGYSEWYRQSSGVVRHGGWKKDRGEGIGRFRSKGEKEDEKGRGAELSLCPCIV